MSVKTFAVYGTRFRLYDSEVFTPATMESVAQFSCWASEIGGELERVVCDGADAESVAEQLGLIERAA